MKTSRAAPAAPAASTREVRDEEACEVEPFPIVGIGASAGGLEAFSALLRHLPNDTGMGFVLVQHLDPEHDSALPQLLRRATSMPVQEATHNLRVEPNEVYVIPPNANLSISDGVLTLTPRDKTRTPHRSIDFFFEALAEDQHACAIGVILSGTATDGTLGLGAIKAEGGITFAQDESARYNSMPRSAVGAGCVDFVLSPDSIAGELARLAKHPALARASLRRGDLDPEATEAGGPARTRGEGLQTIRRLLHDHSGVDFSLYKSSTIDRRITRRMVLGRHDTSEQYVRHLRDTPSEIEALYADALIGVTSFFRNAESFEVMARTIWPALLRQRGDNPLRAWVLGCSTGEEAYSLAMSFIEAADQAARPRKLQVFATDLNEVSLHKARHGLYDRHVARDLSPERLHRFFVEEGGGYRVSKSLREMVVFARQNVISDPPFSRMDLISCRNLLIYFDAALQKRVFPMFHYALRPGGFLYLGASESVGAFTHLFEPVDKKHKLYTKAVVPVLAPAPSIEGGAQRLPRASQTARATPLLDDRRGGGDRRTAEHQALREADRVAVTRFAPPGVLIDAELQILQFRGDTAPYLTPAAGKASFELLKMARPGLMLPLRRAVTKAKREGKPQRVESVKVERGDASATIAVEVIPLTNLGDRCFLVVFEEAGEAASRRRARPAPVRPVRVPRGAEARRILALEAELAETREYLQSIQEQHEAAAEDLQASNEEVQSANEELQSINEELETSKEEMESANEELITLNEEMANRNTELNRLNSDLVNVQTSAHQPIVLLGRDLTIRRFSVQAGIQFQLLPGDVGRPFNHIRHGLDIGDLDTLLADVIRHVRAYEREVRDKDGCWYSLRVRPYVTADNQVDGVVLVLVDINALKRSEQALASARTYADAIARTARDPLLVLNADLRVHTANEAFLRTFKVSLTETAGRHVYELGSQHWDIPALRQLLDDILVHDTTFDDFTVTSAFERIGRRTMLLSARRLQHADGHPARIFLGIQDVTDAFDAQTVVRLSQARYQALVDASAEIVWTTDASGTVGEDSPSWRAFTGQAEAERQGFGWLDAIHPEDREPIRALWLSAIAGGAPVDVTYRLRHVGGSWRWSEMRAVPVMSPDGLVREWVAMNADVTDRRRAEDKLHDSEQRFTRFMDHLPGLAWIKDVRGRYVYANEAAHKAFGAAPDALYGRTDADVFAPATATVLMNHDGLALGSGGSTQTVEALEHDGGVVHPSIVSTFAIPGSDAEAIMVGGVAIDITELTEAEAALRQSEARYRMLFASIDDGFCIIERIAGPDGETTDFRYIEANPAFGVHAGVGDVLGRTIREAFPDEPHEWIATYDAILRTGQALRFERPLASQGRVLELNAFRVEDGSATRVAVVFKDISERRRADDALRDSDRHKSEFLAMLAHELRNPLAPIRNSLEVMHRATPDGSPIAAVAAAEAVLTRQVDQLVRLVDDLLDAGRISRGKLVLRREVVEVAAVVEQALDSVRPTVQALAQTVTVTVPTEPIHLHADPTRLSQLLGNLLNNASKFTERGGGIWLSVELAAGDGGGEPSADPAPLPDVVIRVRDTGIGIAADQRGRVFDMFAQVDTSLGRPVTGLGIGLTLVRTLAEMHGGSVDVASAGIGFGSEFVVRLPSAPADRRSAPRPAPPAAVAPLRILVVDDNLDAAEMLSLLLTSSGHEVHVAHDGVAAVAAAVALCPDVILLDIGLPGMDGYEAARRIRSQQADPGPILVALTGWGQAEDRQRSEAAGFDAHLVKPVDVAELTRTMAALWGRQHPSDAPTTSDDPERTATASPTR